MNLDLHEFLALTLGIPFLIAVVMFVCLQRRGHGTAQRRK